MRRIDQSDSLSFKAGSETAITKVRAAHGFLSLRTQIRLVCCLLFVPILRLPVCAQESDYSFVQTGPCAAVLSNRNPTRNMIAQVSTTKYYKDVVPNLPDRRNYLLKPLAKQRVNCMDSSSPKPDSVEIENNNAVYVESSIETSQVKVIKYVTRQDADVLTALVSGQERVFDCSHSGDLPLPPSLKDKYFDIGPGTLLSLKYVRVSPDTSAARYEWAIVLSWALAK